MNTTFEAYYKDLIKQRCASYAERFSYIETFCTSGGKYVRPELFLQACEAWGQDISEEHLKLATALELLHCFFLIHDDVMDEDDVRRDAPTVHAFYENDLGEREARAIAIVFGDILYTIALELCVEVEKKLGISVLPKVLEVIRVTAEGQAEELVCTGNVTEEKLLTFYEQKTAYYSLYLPLYFAAIVSKRSQEEIEKCCALSKILGKAYQVYDDLIEVKGEKIRRSGGRIGDIARLKATPLLCRALTFIPQDMREHLEEQRRLGKEISLEEETYILDIYREHHIDEDIKTLIHRFVEESFTFSKPLGLDTLPLLEKLLNKYMEA